MHLPALGGAVALLLPAFALAQSPLGILNNTDVSFTSRGSTTLPNLNPCFVYDRLDKEAYAGWGVDPANPGMRQIVGMTATLQDQVGTTPETFGFIVYTELGNGPNYPDVATPLGSISALPTPASTATTAVAWTFTASFATPVLAPATADVFVGAELPTSLGGSYPTDGMSCWALYYQFLSTNSAVWDSAGTAHPTAPPEQVGNGGWYVPNPANGPFYTLTPRQWKIEPMVLGAAGVAGTITNQTSAPSSNLAPGTSSQASGLFPDAENPPLNAGRADDLASRWFMANTPASTPVLFFLGLGNFGPEIPASSFVPGSTGVVCLDLVTMSTLGLGFTDATGQAYFVITIPAAARSSIAGLRLVHQSVGLDVATGAIRANGCTRQIL